MAATAHAVEKTVPVAAELAWQLEGVDEGALRLIPEPEREKYYDPLAAGNRGPHLRRPGSRDYFSFEHGAIQPDSPLLTEVVRRHLGPLADRYKGDTLFDESGRPEYRRCSCGFMAANLMAVDAHRRRFPDHTIE